MIDAETQEVFRQETEALIESLQAGLLALNDRPEDIGLVSQVFRDLHTLKGTGAMFGYTRLAEFIHDFEAAFDAVRSGEANVSPQLISVSLQAYDLIVALLEGEDPEQSLDAALKHALAEATGKVPAAADGADVAGACDPNGAATPAADGWRLTISLPEDLMEIGGNPVALLEEVIEIGGAQTVLRADVSRLPALDAFDPARLYTGWTIELPAAAPEADIRDVFMFHEDRMTLSLEPVAGNAAPGAAAEASPELAPEVSTAVVAAPKAAVAVAEAQTPAQGPTKASAGGKRAAATAAASSQMRVSSERLDDIMDRVGELVIAESRLADLASKLNLPELDEVVEGIQRLALGLRDTTMAIRLSPVSGITGRFRRLAHDLASKTGKAFDLVIEGEETELDKSVIDKLSDPLVHILRNAVDHGLEPTAERVAAGKPERGTVRLVARYSGADVLISVTDDGRGLDPDFIRRRAIERGVIAQDQVLKRHEVFALLLAPGFSTAETVTDLSGRGVGTDVVKTTVESLRGSIDIDSVLGQGTTFTLRLPLTLAIMEGLLFQVGSERYTVPLAAVEGIVEQPEALRGGTATSTVVELRERLVSILRLRQVFRVEGEEPAFPKVVLVRAGDAQVGLVVDEIIGSFQTVIKHLSPLHSRLDIFSGATILGNGNVALILDVAQLVRSQNITTPSQRERAA
ncbi:chemotaxis protein CheA [Meridianimarinicoccus roseus]|uniref:Chemotaxis protein CheA n=1 Tax=Meridianimarinicoccus roseus TaxID=2072018 RepID=A0A2V2LGY5_9RHOB|nr:chemotaxis protein CheA [Meridianimarinicoccus roseus]PWR01163.1 chemotaxis protein CheA [Meridianimarinicoccus roseus]